MVRFQDGSLPVFAAVFTAVFTAACHGLYYCLNAQGWSPLVASVAVQVGIGGLIVALVCALFVYYREENTF